MAQRPDAFCEALKKLAEEIPEFGQLTEAEAKARGRGAAVTDEMILKAIHTLSDSPAIQQVIGRTSEELLQELSDSSAWIAAESDLNVLVEGLRAANLKRRSDLGTMAMRIYQLSRQLIRQPEHQYLSVRVKEMQQMNRLGGRGGAPEEPPQPESEPVSE